MTEESRMRKKWRIAGVENIKNTYNIYNWKNERNRTLGRSRLICGQYQSLS
jgi:hypothetical protein